MNLKANDNITTLDDIIEQKYGKRGNAKREKWEQDFESFRLGVLVEEARNRIGLTQEELAIKCGINKSVISKIENNSSEIKLSIILNIIQNGLGGKLSFNLQM